MRSTSCGQIGASWSRSTATSSTGTERGFERDRRRDQQLVAAGYRVVRVTWIQLRDGPIAVITSIAQALALSTRLTG